MKALALLILAGAVLALGAEKRGSYQREVQFYRDYALSLQRLSQLIREEKCPLPQALERAGQGSAGTYFLALKAALRTGKQAEVPYSAPEVPLQLLCTSEAQAGLIDALAGEVDIKRQALEAKLPDRSRSAMTFSAALAALLVIVLM